MPRQLSYDFEELPLFVRHDIKAGLISGSALIDYWPDAIWGISELYVDGFIENDSPRGFERKSLMLDRATPVYEMIFDRLATDWRSRVQAAVNNAITEEREAACA
jgi:hypothetical protein